MKKCLFALLVCMVGFTSVALYAKPPTRAQKTLKQRRNSTAKPVAPLSTSKEAPPPHKPKLLEVPFRVVLQEVDNGRTAISNQSTLTNTIAIPWPKIFEGDTIQHLGFEIVSASFDVTDKTFFKTTLPTTWKKSSPLQTSVSFEASPYSFFDVKKLQYEASVVFFGYQGEKHEKVELLRANLKAEIVFPIVLACSADDDLWLASPTSPTAKVTYTCKNNGRTKVKLTDFKQSCAENAWSFPESIEIEPGATQMITSSVMLPTNEDKEYACDLSFLANGEKPEIKPLVTQVRMSTAAFALRPKYGEEQGNLVFTDGMYHVQFHATPAKEEQSLELQVWALSGYKIRSLNVTLPEGSSFQSKATDRPNELTLSFAPKQAIFAQEKRTLVIHYEVGNTLHTKQIVVLLEGDATVKNSITLPRQVLDIEPAKGTQEGYHAYDFVPMPQQEKLLGITSKTAWMQWRGTKNIFSQKHRDSYAIYRATYNPEEFGIPKKSWYVLPPTLEGTVEAYWCEYKKPYVLNQLLIPTTIRYRPQPLDLLVQAQMDPGVGFDPNPYVPKEGSPFMGARLEVLKLFASDTPKLNERPFQREKLMVRLGLSWAMGGLFTPSFASTQKSWNASSTLAVAVEVGGGWGGWKGDRTNSHRVSLFGHAGAGWNYEANDHFFQERAQQRPDQHHNAYLDIGARFQIHPFRKIPGLYLTASALLGMYLPITRARIEVPIGIGFHF